MTPNKEDYIKQSIKLGGKDEFVTNKAINQMLDLSAASTTEMLNSLSMMVRSNTSVIKVQN